MTNESIDLVIIGGGPAGTAAAVYAARKQLRTVIIAKEFGGQSNVSEEIYNWIGTPAISGADLAKSFETHIREYEGEYLTIAEGALVTNVAQDGDQFTVATDRDNTYTTRSVLVASGSSRRKLTVPGAEKFENKGVVYCASCDGPLFSGQDVAVIGGGNAGFESAAQLLAYCKSVTLLQHGERYKADKITVEKVLSEENMTGLLHAEISEIYGDAFVQGIKYKETQSGEEKDLPVSGVFVEIGQIPNTDIVKDVVERDKYNRITIDPWTQQTSTPGVYAAGDCTNIKYHQNNIAAGDAVRALEDIYLYLKTK